MSTQYALGIVKNSEPETFVILGLDTEKGALSYAAFLKEKDLRSQMKENGIAEPDIESEIQAARQKPRV